MIKEPSIIEFNKIGDSSLGYISVAQVKENIPFGIKRVYWTYFTPNHIQRGAHAHKTLKQVLVAVSGSIEVTLKNRDDEEFHFVLNNPSYGLFIPENYWRDMQFSHNGVLLSLASAEFDELDYIRDLTEFLSGNNGP